MVVRTCPGVVALAVALMVVPLVPGCRDDGSAGSPAPATQPDTPPRRAGDDPIRPAGNWPQFRGPTADGVAGPGARPPVNIELPRDVRFKTAVPAKGQSSPILWGDRIFLTGEGDRILAFDRRTGRLLWNTALKAPPPVTMPDDEDFDASLEDTGTAASTPCTDGERVYAFFGTGTLGCVDWAGRQVWADHIVPGVPRNTFGLAASPVLYDDLVIQVVDMGGEPEDGLSFIVALRARDGVEVWRRDRPVQSAWATPLVLRSGSGDQLITAALPLAISYDPKTGTERWRVDDVGGDVAASPVAGGNLVYVLGGEGDALWAIRPDGQGDVTKTHVLWKKRPPMPDVASPICDGRRYFHISSGGDLLCLDASNGKEIWTKEFRGTFWASPVLVGDRLYLVNGDGDLSVVAAADGRLLGKVKLGEKTTASPAVLDGRIYLRTVDHLLCLGHP